MFIMVRMLESVILVASCGLAWDLLIALFMPPLVEEIGWMINGSSRLEIDGGCHASIR